MLNITVTMNDVLILTNQFIFRYYVFSQGYEYLLQSYSLP